MFFVSFVIFVLLMIFLSSSASSAPCRCALAQQEWPASPQQSSSSHPPSSAAPPTCKPRALPFSSDPLLVFALSCYQSPSSPLFPWTVGRNELSLATLSQFPSSSSPTARSPGWI